MPNYTALADQAASQGQAAAAQGQQMLADDNNKAADYTNQYNTYQNQANAAQKSVSDYTTAMKGAYNADTGTGNAQSAFDYNQGQQLNKVGYDANLAADATRGLSQALGAQSSYNNFINSASSKFGGMDSGAFAAFNANGQAQNNQNVNQASQLSNALLSKYTAGSETANKVVGLQQKGQEDTLAGLQNVYTNAANQRDSAASQMQFYRQLAASQGGLNAQQATAYHSIVQGYAQAQLAMANIGLILSQTTGQNIKNTSDQNNLNMSLAQQQAAAQKKSNDEYSMMRNGTGASAPTAASNGQSSYANFVHRISGINPSQDIHNWIGNAISPWIH